MLPRLVTINPFAVLTVICLISLCGCGPDTDIVGNITPNMAPTTEITGYPPTVYETTYTVSFSWTGFDNDGRVEGFLWRMSNNGTDGISYRDTLTRDPNTGQTINPWHFTTTTDTTFLVQVSIREHPLLQDEGQGELASE